MGARNGISGREAMYNAQISRRIEALRVKQGVSKKELAEAAGVTQPMLHAYEVGRSRWPVFRVWLIAAYLRVSVESVMRRSKTYVKPREIQEDLF